MPSNTEYSRLVAECAALRASLAMLIAGLHGRLHLGSIDNWRDGRMAAYAAALAGQDGRDPRFAEAHSKIRDAVLAANGKG